MDITSNNLEAAILDQVVAGQMRGRTYAFTPVFYNKRWRLGVAVEGEPGYNPIDGKDWERHECALQFADGMNRHLGLTDDQALKIIASTMRRR